MSRVLIVLLAVAAASLPGTAQAWRGWYGYGPVFVAPPVFIGPPVYYGAPVYYPPPRPIGEACYAGAYVCPLDHPGPVGAPCSCPTNGGRAGGRIG